MTYRKKSEATRVHQDATRSRIAIEQRLPTPFLVSLMIQIQKLIASRRLKQRNAAKILGVTQPRVSDLLRGRIDLFSTDALIDMLARLAATVRLTVTVRPAA